ncbi:MAG: M48 family metalloprotease [Ferruginibacter sp.]
MRLLLLLILALPCCSLFAQQSVSYTPLLNDSVQLSRIFQSINSGYLADSAAIKGDNKKYIVEIYRSRRDDLRKMFTDNSFFYTGKINTYLAALTGRITAANPVLNKLNPRFLISKDFIPNAFSTGEGTIVMNIGLFTKLKNESQVIFALCHELAHLYLDHSNQSIRQHISSVYSDDVQEKLKALNKQKYEKNKELDLIEKKLAFSGRRHSRLHETEADSLGLILMKNTVFNVKESLACLAILDSIDTDSYPTEKELPSVLTGAGYPFRAKWLKKESGFFGVSAGEEIKNKDTDSLKTHPDCKLRIRLLEPAVGKIIMINTALNPVDPLSFNELQNNFRFEEIQYCYDSRKISRCLFLALDLYKKEPGNIYPVVMIGKCFNRMYENQKLHNLSDIVALPSPYRDKNYNTLLEFIQNISLRDMAGIGYQFLQQFAGKYASDAAFAETLTTATTHFNAH